MESLSSPINLILVVCIILMVVLTFVVFKHGKQNISNKIFGFFIISALAWIFTNLIANLSCSNQGIDLLLWTKLSLVGPVFLPILLNLFAGSFPENKIALSKVYIFILGAITLGILLLIPTDLNVKSVQVMNYKTCEFSFSPGPLYTFFTLYLLFGIFTTAYILIKKYLKGQIIEKLQIKYVLIGLISSVLVGVLISAILPMFGYSQLINIGPAASLFFIGFTAYAIIKHQLLDIRLIVAETVTYLVIIVLTIEIFFSRTFVEGLFRFLFLLIMGYGGYVLIRSMKREIQFRMELQEMAEQLSHANSHLKELDRMKTEFVSLASHELLTPVSAIEGYLSMLLDEKLAKVDDPKAVHYMDRVYRSAKRLARLVTDMLNVSRIEEGRLLVEKKEVSLAGLITQTIDELKFKAEDAKQKIAFEAQNHWETFADPDKLKEILVNLIGNSIKYSKGPGTITVSVETAPTSEVGARWQKVEEEIKAGPLDDQEAIKSATDERLRRLVGEKQILIHIKDEGIGIPREELPRLFKKFHRVGDYSRAESQGTGLGLYISRALVELHHGRIWADSEGHSKGSIFTFSLPELASKQAIIDLEKQVPKNKEQLKPLAQPPKEAEEL